MTELDIVDIADVPEKVSRRRKYQEIVAAILALPNGKCARFPKSIETTRMISTLHNVSRMDRIAIRTRTRTAGKHVYVWTEPR